jgi:glycosyltransferase involved in cell wall biosynthesis
VGVWHIITGEYPPQAGGVSDYTWLVANGLAAAGNIVHVWAPQCGLPGNRRTAVGVHRLSTHFGPCALAPVARAIRADRACSVLVQYVPHAYGFKAMNLPFCLWLQSFRHADLTVMFHEVAFPVGRAQPLRHNLLGAVTRLMARLVSHSATRIMVASARWQVLLIRLGATAPISWVPVPSNIPVVKDAAATAKWRRRCTEETGLLIGHFANYSDYSVERLSQVMPGLLAERRQLSLLLLGAKSGELRQRLLDTNPQLAGLVHASGPLPPQDLSAAIAACDLMVQPYPDGVSTRRGSTAALLAHGRAIVTTNGIATERLWNVSGAVATAPADDPNGLRDTISQMLSSYEVRHGLAWSALDLYDKRFALRHTIAALMAS